MAYVHPSQVTTPQSSVSNVRPIFNKGERSWSVALLDWEGSLAVGLRWNGGGGSDDTKPQPGNPQSRGYPTWFICPDLLSISILHALIQYNLFGEEGNKIDPTQARQWVDEALKDLEGSDIRSDDFAQRVKEIVKTMKDAGEI